VEQSSLELSGLVSAFTPQSPVGLIRLTP
jgi:hypothetical protein